jgi:tetratricopeptide (TPR) repeat protein
MLEQSEVKVAPDSPIVLGGRGLSAEVRASLEAVRVAQEAARARARRQTVQTRIWFALLLGTVALCAVAFGPRLARLARLRHAPAPVAAPVAAPAQPAAMPAPPEPVAPSIAAPAVAPAITSAPETPAPAPAPAAAPTKARGGAAADEECDTSLVRKTPWLLSPEACARAFDADPRNASLALGIAHAEHVRGRGAEAAQWAQRALEIDPNRAEAYVLIARADKASGRPDDARAAYQRYLELAPRGWHKTEARTALREAGAASPPSSTRGR